jgi:hypothetical protein
MSNSLSFLEPLEKQVTDCSGGRDMGGENHNHLLLLIPGLSLRHIFLSSIFPQAHTTVNFIEAHFYFIQLKYKTAVHK